LLPDFRFIRTLQSPHHIIFDEKTGLYRISSKAFTPSSSDGKLSGDLEEVLAADGLGPTAIYPAVRDAVGAASVTVGEIRALQAEVDHDPTRENWYHGAATGCKKKSVKQKLSAAASEIVPINQAKARELDRMLDAGRTYPGEPGVR